MVSCCELLIILIMNDGVLRYIALSNDCNDKQSIAGGNQNKHWAIKFRLVAFLLKATALGAEGSKLRISLSRSEGLSPSC